MVSSERDRQREQFLLELYNVVDGDTNPRAQISNIGGLAGLDEKRADRVAQWLYERGLVDFPAMGGSSR